MQVEGEDEARPADCALVRQQWSDVLPEDPSSTQARRDRPAVPPAIMPEPASRQHEEVVALHWVMSPCIDGIAARPARVGHGHALRDAGMPGPALGPIYDLMSD